MNITHGLRRALQVNPDGLATVFGGRRRNWREIGDRVARLASGFHALGVRPGDRVAILSLNSDRYLEVYLATGWAGAVVVPLNIRWSPLENEDAMRDCIVLVLMSPDFCYRVDLLAGSSAVEPLSDYALASRLSYFLWSSMPDAELLSHAAAGRRSSSCAS